MIYKAAPDGRRFVVSRVPKLFYCYGEAIIGLSCSFALWPNK
jgi:hypothetical protein